MDVVESALRDVNLSSGREIVLKPEQESAVRALLADRDVLAVLPTGYGKSLIYQMQGHPMDLFLKISVLQAHFCWLGDVKEIIVLGRKVLLGKR